MRDRLQAVVLCWVFVLGSVAIGRGDELRLGVFELDASPRVGSPLAYDPCVGIQQPLSCRGIVLLGSGEPIVLAAIDWIGVSNEAHDAFRKSLAGAVKTSVSRVSVHALHQHDAPSIDLTIQPWLEEEGISAEVQDVEWYRDFLKQLAQAAGESCGSARKVTHLGLGQGEVHEVASNRRLLDESGKVYATRYTATKDPELRAAPVGTIDPMLKLISFWDGDEPMVALTYYATHPQSYYRTGLANPDFPGMARNQRDEATGLRHIHFNGAGGNIGAGKWNDGSPANRQVLADKVAAGMKEAWESTERQSITAADVSWVSESVALPPAEHLDETMLRATMGNEALTAAQRASAASHLAWLVRCRSGHKVDIGCLHLGGASIVHMPGELFVEYQLAAQEMAADRFVAMAAYGDYGPGYIGTEIAYGQGGYETSQRASRVSPTVEKILLPVLRRLLDGE